MKKRESAFQKAKKMFDKGLYEKAIRSFEALLETDNGNWQLRYYLAKALLKLHYYEKAYNQYVSVIKLNPDCQLAREDLAGICFIQGQYFVEQGKMNEALKWIEESAALAPNKYRLFELSYAYLMAGRFREGFDLFEVRQDAQPTQKYMEYLSCVPKWQNEDLNGKRLLLQHEHGFGDSIQFALFLRFLKRCGVRTCCSVPRELARLFEYIEGVDEVFCRQEVYADSVHDYLKKIDYYLPMMSLAHRLIHSRENIVFPVDKYIYVDNEDIKKWSKVIAEQDVSAQTAKLKVGFCWACNAERDYGRTIPLQDFAEIFVRNCDVDFYSLQVGKSGELAQSLERYQCDSANVFDFTEQFQDFYDTAAFMENMDLIITVDTALAHLAGALAKKTWLLLPVPDLRLWRWGIKGDKCLWYGNFKIWRATKRGEWSGVLKDIINKIAKEI